MRLSRILFALLVWGLLSSRASATPVLWTLEGVTFDDGGTAAGSFVYDADFNQYSAVSVTTTPGSVVLTGVTLTFVGTGFPPDASAVLTEASNAANLTGTRGFALFFSPVLTNAGGRVSLSGQEATCGDATCSFPAPPMRFVTAGSLVAEFSAAAAPALDATGLVLLVLVLSVCGFFFLRRRRAA